ncbi:uncharacterized protein LOC125005455 isoform X2 [Mugil cephalus]|nr:uncharacterized protein LOC125005455 isoform X2 [Mugil cephalus]
MSGEFAGVFFLFFFAEVNFNLCLILVQNLISSQEVVDCSCCKFTQKAFRRCRQEPSTRPCTVSQLVLGRQTNIAALLVTMDMIIVLLCALASQVASQTKEISPARILAQQTVLSENSDLYLTCSTFGRKKNSEISIYLVKDGVEINKITHKQEKNDVTFHIPRVSLRHTGKYSCVYSLSNYTPTALTVKGENVIDILVIASSVPADISLAGPSTIHEGHYVEFRCSVSSVLRTPGGCQLIQSFLKKNGTVLRVQAFNITRMETTFTIRDVVLRDSGLYSCTVLPVHCIQEMQIHENTHENLVYLEVKGDFARPMIIFGAVLMLILLISLVLLWISRKPEVLSLLCKPRPKKKQENTNTLEEESVHMEEQGLQARGGEKEKEEESHRTVEDAEYNNVSSSFDYDDCEGVYSVAD